MVGILAGRITFIQYRMMLIYSLRGDRMMAQLTMKNIVLLTAVLILTYGLYVPKSWRRAALVVGPLALLPFAAFRGADAAARRQPLGVALGALATIKRLRRGERRTPSTLLFTTRLARS